MMQILFFFLLWTGFLFLVNRFKSKFKLLRALPPNPLNMFRFAKHRASGTSGLLPGASKLLKKFGQNFFVVWGVILLFSACGTDMLAFSSNLLAGNGWSYVAAQRTGTRHQDVSLGAESLAAFHVESFSESGLVTLVVTQGEVALELDISGDFADFVDLSDFEPGDLRLRLRFFEARRVDVTLTW